MKFESAAVYAGEKVPAQPRNQNRQRAKGGCEERNQENPAVVETAFQQPAIACDGSSRMRPQTCAAAGPADYGLELGFSRLLSDRSAKDTWPSSARWFAKESTMPASRKLPLRRAAQRDTARRRTAGTWEQTQCRSTAWRRKQGSRFAAALSRTTSSMSLSGSASRLRLMFSTSTVASSTRIPTARASPPSVMMLMVSPIALNTMIEVRIARGIEVAMINGASPTAQKSENHESGQARGDQCFPDDSADRAPNKNRLIGQRCHLQLRWNRRLDLRQKGS